MAALIWSEKSLADIEELYDYIAVDSPFYARHQVEKIVAAAERLRDFPESGRTIPEFPHAPYREIIVDPYRLIYRHIPGSSQLVVVAVVHGKRLLKENALQ